MNRHSKLMVFAAFIALCTAGGAEAQEIAKEEAGKTVGHVAVFTGDLDLSRLSGVAVLASRIKSAAIQACGGRPDSRELDSTTRFDACRKQAISAAATHLGNPLLTAMLGFTAPEMVAQK